MRGIPVVELGRPKLDEGGVADVVADSEEFAIDAVEAGCELSVKVIISGLTALAFRCTLEVADDGVG